MRRDVSGPIAGLPRMFALAKPSNMSLELQCDDFSMIVPSARDGMVNIRVIQILSVVTGWLEEIFSTNSFAN